jgi:hypothetical protein
MKMLLITTLFQPLQVVVSKNHFRPHNFTNVSLAACFALFHCANDSNFLFIWRASFRDSRMHTLSCLTASRFVGGGFRINPPMDQARLHYTHPKARSL